MRSLWAFVLLGQAAIASAAQEARPTDAAAERSPRLSWVWMDADVGYQSISLRTFNAGRDDFTVGFIPESKAGPTMSLGLGARLVFVTLGVRFNGSFFDESSNEGNLDHYQLWSLDGEVGVHLPFGRLEPYIQVAAGYSAFGGLDDAVEGLREGMDISGVNTRLGLGLDYYLTRHFSVGVRGAGELLFLSRRGVPVRDLLEPQRVDTLGELRTRALEADGSTIGTALSLGGSVGVHF